MYGFILLNEEELRAPLGVLESKTPRKTLCAGGEMLSLNQSLSKEKSCIFYFLVDLGQS